MTSIKQLPVSNLKSGMVLNASVRTKRGQTIAKAGTVLNHQLIARLNFYHIESVAVEIDLDNELISDAPASDQAPAPAPSPIPAPQPPVQPAPAPAPAPVAEPKPEKHERTYVEDNMSFTHKMEQSPEYIDFQMAYTLSMKELNNIFEEIRSGVYDFSQGIILPHGRELFRNRTPLELFNLVHGQRTLNDSIYAHCLNVAMISRVIGRWLRLEKPALEQLVSAALVHDIGKTSVAPDILNKTGRLTDEEFDEIKKHTIYGQKLLKAAGAPSYLCYAAVQHHERFDGSGYPRGLENYEIDDFASIIGIADVYDAMTAARPYRAPLCAFQVIEEFEEEGLAKYNTKFILTFLNHIASMYQNSRVILNDGRTARIVYINHSAISRPIVEDVSTGDIIDLSSKPELHITSTL